jgi:hypothetical protein
MKHIFISYSHADSAMMKRLRADLLRAKLDVWTDEGLEPGLPSWRDSIEKAIKEASCVIVLLSPDAKLSEWVNREIDYAQAHKIRIFPAWVTGDETDAIPFALISSQRADLRSNKTYAAEVDKLITSVCQHTDVQLPEIPVVKRSRRKRQTWIAVGVVVVSVLAGVIAVLVNQYLDEDDPPVTPLEHLIDDADGALCPGSSADEYAASSRSADNSDTAAACVQHLLDWENEADQQQETRLEIGTCHTKPTPYGHDLETHLASYWALDDLAFGYWNLANHLRDERYTELAQEAYQTIVDEYSCAWVYDDTVPEFWELAPRAQAELDEMRGD